jgi:hypothetical protein
MGKSCRKRGRTSLQISPRSSCRGCRTRYATGCEGKGRGISREGQTVVQVRGLLNRIACKRLCNSTKPSRTWTCGARAAQKFRSSSHLPVRPVPASTAVAAFLRRGGRSIRAKARSKSPAHHSAPSRTPRRPATQCLGNWSGPKEPGSAAQANRAAPLSLNTPWPSASAALRKSVRTLERTFSTQSATTGLRTPQKMNWPQKACPAALRWWCRTSLPPKLT